jgi:hypothetical protein
VARWRERAVELREIFVAEPKVHRGAIFADV